MINLSKKISGIFVAVFVIGFFVLTLVREKGIISFHENKVLATPPEISQITE